MCIYWSDTNVQMNISATTKVVTGTIQPNVFHYSDDVAVMKFQIECTCPSGKWIVKITCPNVPFTCLKYITPMQLMWESEICSRPSDKSCRYSTCPTVIFTRLRRSDEWNFEPCRRRHNEHDGVSGHQPYDCSLNRLFRPISKKTPKLGVTGLCVGNSPVTRKMFPFDFIMYIKT